jgi:hypothetical protein
MPVNIIEVKPSPNGNNAIVDFGNVEVIAESAYLDDSSNLELVLDNRIVAKVEVNGVPVEVTNMVRRAIRYEEKAVWKSQEYKEEW